MEAKEMTADGEGLTARDEESVQGALTRFFTLFRGASHRAWSVLPSEARRGVDQSAEEGAKAPMPLDARESVRCARVADDAPLPPVSGEGAAATRAPDTCDTPSIPDWQPDDRLRAAARRIAAASHNARAAQASGAASDAVVTLVVGESDTELLQVYVDDEDVLVRWPRDVRRVALALAHAWPQDVPRENLIVLLNQPTHARLASVLGELERRLASVLTGMPDPISGRALLVRGPDDTASFSASCVTVIHADTASGAATQASAETEVAQAAEDAPDAPDMVADDDEVGALVVDDPVYDAAALLLYVGRPQPALRRGTDGRSVALARASMHILSLVAVAGPPGICLGAIADSLAVVDRLTVVDARARVEAEMAHGRLTSAHGADVLDASLTAYIVVGADDGSRRAAPGRDLDADTLIAINASVVWSDAGAVYALREAMTARGRSKSERRVWAAKIVSVFSLDPQMLFADIPTSGVRMIRHRLWLHWAAAREALKRGERSAGL